MLLDVTCGVTEILSYISVEMVMCCGKLLSVVATNGCV